MAILRKFKALRPKEGLEKEVASYPYDVLNSEEARDLVAENPISFLHVVKPEVDLPEGTDLYSPAVYQKARENLDNFVAQDVIIQEKEARLYIYRQIMEGKEQYGIVGCVSVDDYDNNVIKKHEHTRPVKENDRIRHVDVTNVNAGPIFLTYRRKESIDVLVADIVSEKAIYDFNADDGIQHTVWIVPDDAADRLIELFGEIDFLYVADGHHRSASAAKVANMRRSANPHHSGDEEYNYFLAVLFPDLQLRILDYNRVVRHLNGHNRDELMEHLNQWFTVEDKGEVFFKPAEKGWIGMYFEKKWYALKIRSENIDFSDPVGSLDISYLQNNVLAPFFGIEDPRTSEDIDFIGGIRGLQELVRLVDEGKFQVAFAMYPTSVEELMRIADSGQVMPPKSTWFEPKLRS